MSSFVNYNGKVYKNDSNKPIEELIEIASNAPNINCSGNACNNLSAEYGTPYNGYANTIFHNNGDKKIKLGTKTYFAGCGGTSYNDINPHSFISILGPVCSDVECNYA